MDDFIPYNRWLHQHDERIKAEFADRPTEALAEECDVNYYTISRRATRLGVSKSPDFMHSSWQKGGGRRAMLSDEVKQYLRAHFADTSNADLATHFGVDMKTVRRWARRLGLVKSEAFMQEVRSRGKRGKPFYADEQIAWRNRRIAEVYPDADEEELCRLADALGIAVDTLKSLASRIGARRSAERRREAYKRNTKYGPEFMAALRDYFPGHTNAECAAHFGIKESVLKKVAYRAGLRKSEEYTSRARREAIRIRKQNKIKVKN